MSVDFTPTLKPYKHLDNFRIWCQKVLPLVYDDSLSYYEVLCKLSSVMNDMINNQSGMYDDITGLSEAYQQLQNYVNNYFENLDVQEEINNKIDSMVEDGSLEVIISEHLKLGNALYIGNSYANGGGSTSGETGIYALTKDMFYNTWLYTSGGIGFCHYSLSEDNSFVERLQAAASGIAEADRATINYVIFLSAIGDSRYAKENSYPNYNEITVAINSCKNIIAESFPNAQMYVVFCDVVLNDSKTTLDLKAQIWVHNCFENLSNQLDFNYLGWIGWPINHKNGYNAADGYHPNDAGYGALNSGFRAAINGKFQYNMRKNRLTPELGGGNWVIYTTPKLCIIMPTAAEEAPTVTAGESPVFYDFSEYVGLYPIFSPFRINALILNSDLSTQYSIFTMDSNNIMHLNPSQTKTLYSQWLINPIIAPMEANPGNTN